MFTERKTINYKDKLSKDKIAAYYNAIYRIDTAGINKRKYTIVSNFSIYEKSSDQDFTSIENLMSELSPAFSYDSISIQVYVLERPTHKDIMRIHALFYMEDSVHIFVDSRSKVKSEDILNEVCKLVANDKPEIIPIVEIQTSKDERKYVKDRDTLKGIAEKHWKWIIAVIGWVIAIADIILRICGK